MDYVLGKYKLTKQIQEKQKTSQANDEKKRKKTKMVIKKKH